MRRAVLLLIALLFQLQLAWGAMAAYCQHETGPASHHLGHHAHVHKAEAGQKADGSHWGADGDCGVCHAGALTALTGAVDPLVPAPARLAPEGEPTHWRAAPAPEGPERPKWARLA